MLGLTSFLLACLIFYFAPAWVGKTPLMDRPGGRKLHETSVPLVGGLVITPLFFLTLIFAGFGGDYWAVIFGAALLLCMGAVDDVLHLNPYFKFAGQMLVACFVVIFGGIEVQFLGNLFGLGDIWLGFIAKPFTILCLVLLMNALNMMDGLDGLAAGTGMAILLTLGVAAYLTGAGDLLIVVILYAGPLAAFLIYNLRYPGHARASIFLGDAGSLTLGFLLGCFIIQASQAPQAVIPPVMAAWLVALPVADTLCLYVMRAARGHNPFGADRNHVHHRLLRNGINPGKTTAILVGVSFIFMVAALILHRVGVPDALLFAGFLLMFCVHMIFVFRPQYYTRLLRALP